MQIDTETVEALGLHRLRHCLAEMDMTLDDAGLPAEDIERLRYLGRLYKAKEGDEDDVEASIRYVEDVIPKLNREQLNVYTAVTDCLDRREGGMFYLDGPGGTGKTFVMNAILHNANAMGISYVAVASSGVAALLLLHGETAHSALKVPIHNDESTTCNFDSTDKAGRRLKAASLLVWDEIAMQNKSVIHCVDRSLRDLRGSTAPFGGICVLFGGDFRQTMPVIPQSSMQQQANASLKMSPLWPKIDKFALHVNLRMRHVEGQSAEEAEDNAEFGDWLLRLGNGALQEEDCALVDIEKCVVTTMASGVDFDAQAVREHYEELNPLVGHENWKKLGEYYSDRCILTPLNADVNTINDGVLADMVGEESQYQAFNIAEEEFDEMVSPEILNSCEIASFPKNMLNLKPGVPLMLLRNLNLAQGLCNGTRLIVTKCGTNALRCRIVSGRQRGKMVMLPKIKTLHTADDVMPLTFYRHQFPVALAFAMTVNKAQGQSVNKVMVSLPNDVFAHGQLYVALSRCTSAGNVRVSMKQRGGVKALNIVHQGFLAA